MPVFQAADGMAIEPNHIYVIPPKKCLTIFNGRLQLMEWDSKKGPNFPIDLFFTSLAQDRGERAVAVALSGTGSDGTRGIRAIKEAGGLVMIQDEKSAKFSGMPHSAIETGLADFILPVSELPLALLRFIRHPLFAAAGGRSPHPSAMALQKIEGLVRSQTGIDFSGYKQGTVMRRLERRMGISQVDDAARYLEVLRHSPTEVAAFANDLLIGVTRFFRDSEAFKALREEVIPSIFANASADRSIRAWVAGCATGEEAYSLAILMQEHAATLDAKYAVKIFATDLSSNAIEFAGKGVYPASIAADVSPELLARYFTVEDKGFRISRGIREQVIFARHNILKDPPFTRLDLASCRNLLIYLQSPWQRKVLSLLHFALRPKGYLFLGSSETVGEQHDAFASINAKARIFRKCGAADTGARDIANFTCTLPRIREALPAPPPGGRRPEDKLWGAIASRLIADYVPTGFAVNEKDEILYSFGRPQAFIALQAGRANLDLLKLVPPDLSLALATALRKSRKRKAAVHFRDVKFRREKSASLLDLEVRPLPVDPDEPAVWLIFLQDKAEIVSASAGEDFDPGDRSSQRIAELEEDLRESRETLQIAIEHRETATEELQSTNEELIASNEELQSTNEELESINEELVTLNAEYQQKNNELLVANNDIDNFLRTSQIGTIFLDEALRIRRFTPFVAEEMKLLPQDAGRLLTDLSHPLIDELSREAHRVLRDRKPIEKTVETRPGVWHLLRISPYRRAGTSDLGIVVTFVDVSAIEQARKDLRQRSPKKGK